MHAQTNTQASRTRAHRYAKQTRLSSCSTLTRAAASIRPDLGFLLLLLQLQLLLFPFVLQELLQLLPLRLQLRLGALVAVGAHRSSQL